MILQETLARLNRGLNEGDCFKAYNNMTLQVEERNSQSDEPKTEARVRRETEERVRREIKEARPETSVGFEGKFVRTWGSNGSGQGQFNYPYGITVSGQEVYVSDCHNHRVQVFSKDGTFLRLFGSQGSGQGQFNRPYGITVSGQEVYVSDWWNHRVQVFSKDGTFLRLFGSEGSGQGQFNYPSGITVSGQEVYVSSRDKVQVFR